MSALSGPKCLYCNNVCAPQNKTGVCMYCSPARQPRSGK